MVVVVVVAEIPLLSSSRSLLSNLNPSPVSSKEEEEETDPLNSLSGRERGYSRT